jgi:pyruvate dehydrogenase E1 component beta subunit
MMNHASRLRWRTRGRLTCPMVLRAPYGGGIRAPESHSESTEALFTHIPGLRVVISVVAGTCLWSAAGGNS